MQEFMKSLEILDQEFIAYKTKLENYYTLEYSNILRQKILAFQNSSIRLDIPSMISTEFIYGKKLEDARKRFNVNIEQENFKYISIKMKLIRIFDEKYYQKEIDRAFSNPGPLSMFAYRV
jgi:hypothetical protein